MLTIYKGLVRPCMEYASHIWGGSTHTALLNRVESKALRLTDCPHLSYCHLPLKSRRTVASLSIFYRYFHAHCSSEVADCMPPPLPEPRQTRLSSFAHPYSIQTPYARVIFIIMENIFAHLLTRKGNNTGLEATPDTTTLLSTFVIPLLPCLF